jgi:hypothetical protein
MTLIRSALLAALFAAAPMLPASAGSQSSNSSSNCSDGRCTRVETYAEDRGSDRWGWRRVERWRERPAVREGRHQRDEGRWRQEPRQRDREDDGEDD